MWKVLCNSFPHSQILLDLRATLVQKAAGGWVSSVLRLCKFLCLASVEMEASLLSLGCEARSSSHRHSILISNVLSLVAVVLRPTCCPSKVYGDGKVNTHHPVIQGFFWAQGPGYWGWRWHVRTLQLGFPRSGQLGALAISIQAGSLPLEALCSLLGQHARLPGRMGKSFLFKCHHDWCFEARGEGLSPALWQTGENVFV